MSVRMLSDDRAPRFESVSIPDLLEKQSRVVRETLAMIADHLEERNREHRALHMDKKLADVFPQTLGYYFQKVFEATQRPELHQLGQMHVDLRPPPRVLSGGPSQRVKRSEWLA